MTFTVILYDGDVEVERHIGLATNREATRIGEQHILRSSDQGEGPDDGPFFTIIEET
ncbi:hypothetical protein [Cupriavidus sp. RAF12]|uniref:hypothetical protein n=1 Tax=Cupriavidus sp. RAF12 TaxID=3233050 RepID=UPI003F931347